MIQTAECKPSAAISWSPVMANHAPRRLDGPCISLISAAAIQYQGTRRAVHTCRSDCDEYVLTFFCWVMCLWLPFILSYQPPLTPSCYLVISESTHSQYLLWGVFFYKLLIKHTDTQTYCCHFTHWRRRWVLSTHTHTYTDHWLLRQPQCATFLIKALRAYAFISITTAGATICFYYRFASFNLFLPCQSVFVLQVTETYWTRNILE